MTDTKYDYVIDTNFTKRVNRAFMMTLFWLFFLSVFTYQVFTSNAWIVEILGVKISTYYFPPIIAILPTFHEEIRLIKNYAKNSFKSITIINNEIIGKNFFNQPLIVKNPIVSDWDFRVKKTWYVSKNDEVLTTSFIKLSQGDDVLLIPNSKANVNFIKKLQEISTSQDTKPNKVKA